MTSTTTFAEWAIVELLGHRRVAGYLQETQLAGSGFLRLDIPDAPNQPGRTQFIAPGSVYAIHPVTEAVATAFAANAHAEPVSQWDLRQIEAKGIGDSGNPWAAE